MRQDGQPRVKESNRLEEAEAGLGRDPDKRYTEYADPWRDAWRTLVLPMLRQMLGKELAAATGLSERAIKALRNGRASPRPGNREVLVRAAATFARDQLHGRGLGTPADDLAACAADLDELAWQPE